MARERIRTTIPEIVDYWAKHTGECGLSVDFAERCHIVPASLGGEDTPSNFVILCKRCHLETLMWRIRRSCGTGCGHTACLFMTPSGG